MIDLGLRLVLTLERWRAKRKRTVQLTWMHPHPILCPRYGCKTYPLCGGAFGSDTQKGQRP